MTHATVSRMQRACHAVRGLNPFKRRGSSNPERKPRDLSSLSMGSLRTRDNLRRARAAARQAGRSPRSRGRGTTYGELCARVLNFNSRPEARHAAAGSCLRRRRCKVQRADLRPWQSRREHRRRVPIRVRARANAPASRNIPFFHAPPRKQRRDNRDANVTPAPISDIIRSPYRVQRDLRRLTGGGDDAPRRNGARLPLSIPRMHASFFPREVYPEETFFSERAEYISI